MLRVDMHSHVAKDGKLRRKLEWYATWKPGDKYVKLHVPEKMQKSMFYKSITEQGIKGPDPVGSKGSTMSWYTLADGKAFMESLQYEFKGGYASAGLPYKTKNGEYIKFPDRSNRANETKSEEQISPQLKLPFGDK